MEYVRLHQVAIGRAVEEAQLPHARPTEFKHLAAVEDGRRSNVSLCGEFRHGAGATPGYAGLWEDEYPDHGNLLPCPKCETVAQG